MTFLIRTNEVVSIHLLLKYVTSVSLIDGPYHHRYKKTRQMPIKKTVLEYYKSLAEPIFNRLPFVLTAMTKNNKTKIQFLPEKLFIWIPLLAWHRNEIKNVCPNGIRQEMVTELTFQLYLIPLQIINYTSRESLFLKTNNVLGPPIPICHFIHSTTYQLSVTHTQ